MLQHIVLTVVPRLPRAMLLAAHEHANRAKLLLYRGHNCITPGRSLAEVGLSEVQVAEQVRLQIEYYFSVDNLVKDVFLRSKMDDHGWIAVSVRLLACRSQGQEGVRAVICDCLAPVSAGYLDVWTE
jgi:hypothetical protein